MAAVGISDVEVIAAGVSPQTHALKRDQLVWVYEDGRWYEASVFSGALEECAGTVHQVLMLEGPSAGDFAHAHREEIHDDLLDALIDTLEHHTTGENTTAPLSRRSARQDLDHWGVG